MRKRQLRTQSTLRHAFSIDSFCDTHEIGRSLVYKEIRAGRLRACKVRGRTIITAEDAEAWRRSLSSPGDAR
jgi:hypothetical protein